ncbi:MAG: carbohydrate ABC transporter permease [Clostridia bacterium]|nr:carbohydrate ABC transporter permease [Clostridia bacterium]
MKKPSFRPAESGGPNQVGTGAQILLSLLFLLLSLAAIIPLVFVTIVSLSSDASIAQQGYSFFPKEWSLDAYRYLLDRFDSVGHAVMISGLVTVLGTVLSLILISTMAYVLSRDNFRLRKLFLVIVLIPMFFGGGLAASYVVNTQLFRLKNTLWALILPGVCSSWYILVMRNYFRQNIPVEVLESAYLDGASTLRVFFQFAVPLSVPVLMTIGVFEAFGFWNSWYYAILYLGSNHRELYPLQYVLYHLQKNAQFMAGNENISGAILRTLPTESFRMAMVVITILPILVVYPFFRKFLLRGLTIGAIR